MGHIRYRKGDRFGKLTVIEHGHRTAYGDHAYLCNCDCGNQIIVAAGSLTKGNTKSCGCLRLHLPGSKPTHGMTKTRTYKSWRSMHDRCYNPNNDSYKYYGAKGIKVCDRWLHSFENFLADMGIRPEDTELDRILSSENYHKDNCRWVSHKTNMHNRNSTNSGALHLTLSTLSVDQFDRLIKSVGRMD